jgi:hypothetical protein
MSMELLVGVGVGILIIGISIYFLATQQFSPETRQISALQRGSEAEKQSNEDLCVSHETAIKIAENKCACFSMQAREPEPKPSSEYTQTRYFLCVPRSCLAISLI